MIVLPSPAYIYKRPQMSIQKQEQEQEQQYNISEDFSL
jgi:hypothetical protein